MRPARDILPWLVLALLLAALPTLQAQQPPPAEGDEAQLIAVLKSDAELFDKAKACQMLAVKGTKQSVPVLAGLLADPELAHYARFGLEPMPDPAVDEALRQALGQLQGQLLIGVINSIGMRRDAAAVEALQGLLGDADPAVAAAAAAALGRIATPPAVQSLIQALSGPQDPRPAIADACLTAADMLIAAGKQAEARDVFDTLREAELPQRFIIAALHGAIRSRGAEGLPLLVELLSSEDNARFGVALRMAHELGGPKVAAALVEALKTLTTQRQILVVYTLGDLGEASALPRVLELAKTAPPEVRLPAVEVLAELGDASAVAVLLEAAVDTDAAMATAGLNSLAALPGSEVDARLLELIADSQGAQQRMLIALIGLRGIDAAVPQLLKLADAQDPAIRAAAIGALGLTVDLAQLPKLIERLVAATSAEEATALKTALNNAVLRMPDRDAAAAALLAAMAEASLAKRGDLLVLLGVVGGDRALQGVSSAARHPSDEVQDAATRVLGEWMSADAAPVLLELSRTGSEKYKVRTLRGYLRIARQLDVPIEERVAMARKAIEASQRDDEKRLALEILGRYPTAEGLQLTAAHLDNPALKEAAAEAAVAIAEKIVDTQPAAVAAAMSKAAGATADQERAAKAKNLQRRAQRKAPN